MKEYNATTKQTRAGTAQHIMYIYEAGGGGGGRFGRMAGFLCGRLRYAQINVKESRVARSSTNIIVRQRRSRLNNRQKKGAKVS